LLVSCGGAQSEGTGEGMLIPDDPDHYTPPDDSAQAGSSNAPVGAPLQGAWWDLAVQATEVGERERHSWESEVRALPDEARASLITAFEAMADEELTADGVKRAAATAANRRFPAGSPEASLFARGAGFVLGGMVARAGEGLQSARDPIAAGATLLRTIRTMRFPPPSDGETRGRLEREARTAMGASLGAQAEVRSRGR
jgi:hypothetical protein